MKEDGRWEGRGETHHRTWAKERLKVFGQLRAPGVSGIHRYPSTDGVDQVDFLFLKHEPCLVGSDALKDRAVLPSDDREHLNSDSIELVEAAPRARLCEAREELAGNLVVHLVGAIRDNDPDGEPAPEVFRRLSLAGAGGALRRAAHHQPERLSECDVASVG